MEKKILSKLAARTGERGARKSALRRLNIVIFQTRFVKKPPCFVLSSFRTVPVSYLVLSFVLVLSLPAMSPLVSSRLVTSSSSLLPQRRLQTLQQIGKAPYRVHDRPAFLDIPNRL